MSSDSAVTDLTGRVVLVTGGTRGIGAATARTLASRGAQVVITGREESSATEVAVSLDDGVPGSVTATALDVADTAAVLATVRAVAREHGRLDAVVANAGVLEDGLLGMISADAVERQLSTNVTGTLATVQAAAKVMRRQQHGSMVLLASIVGERGNAGQTAYAATKAAVAGIARSAAKELGQFGIRVNAVAPGLIATAMIAHLPSELVDRRVADTALRRLGTPEDVARVIAFLVGDDAAFVTGQVIGVDGGLVL